MATKTEIWRCFGPDRIKEKVKAKEGTKVKVKVRSSIGRTPRSDITKVKAKESREDHRHQDRKVKAKVIQGQHRPEEEGTLKERVRRAHEREALKVEDRKVKVKGSMSSQTSPSGTTRVVGTKMTTNIANKVTMMTPHGPRRSPRKKIYKR